ncbi:MAG: carboxypeptidase regulatory-like domain-containing protein [Bacteroidales bacterium]|nr:carboxypeptidase regulatory-like domain-containing protein [Bacteroidales bacterium]
MAVVDRKKVENVRYLFGSPSTVKSRYNQIKRTFPEGKEYLIFAEPVYVEDTNSILWSTEHVGSIVNFQKLSPTDQSIAKRILTNSIQTLLAAAKQFDTTELSEFIYNCIEIPSMDNVFLVRGNGTDNVVISEWGFVSDAPGMEKGLLARIINVKRADMVFNVIFEDKEPAPNQKFHFEFEDEHQTHISDADAKITLLEVKIDEEVKAFQKEGEQVLNPQSFICYENGRYTLIAVQKIDMNFTVLNQNNEPVPNITFTFEHEGQTVNLTSNEFGKMVLPQIKVGGQVNAYQTKDEAKIHEHSFICEKNKENILKIEEEVVVETPPVIDEPEKFDMRFKVIGPKGNPVPNAKVTIQYDGKTVEKTTDEEGFTTLEDVTPDSQVKVKAIGKNKKK